MSQRGFSRSAAAACRGAGKGAPATATPEPIRIEMPIPPSVNNLFVNVPGRGRVKRKRYNDWIFDAGWAVRAARPRRIAGHYAIDIRVPAARSDLGNVEKPISDLLVELGVVDDDRFAEAITLVRDRAIERVIVTITAVPTPVAPGVPA